MITPTLSLEIWSIGSSRHSLIISNGIHIAFGNLPFEYFKILYFAAIVVAADRMEHESSLAKPLRMAAVLGLVVSFGIVALTHGSLFFAVHMAIGAVAWFVVTLLVFRSRAGGLGKQFSGSLAALAPPCSASRSRWATI